MSNSAVTGALSELFSRLDAEESSGAEAGQLVEDTQVDVDSETDVVEEGEFLDGAEAEEVDEDVEEVEESEEDDDAFYTIKVAGVERDVSLNELIDFAQKGADYTRKTQQLAEERKAFEAERTELQQMSDFGYQMLQWQQNVAGSGDPDVTAASLVPFIDSFDNPDQVLSSLLVAAASAGLIEMSALKKLGVDEEGVRRWEKSVERKLRKLPAQTSGVPQHAEEQAPVQQPQGSEGPIPREEVARIWDESSSIISEFKLEVEDQVSFAVDLYAYAKEMTGGNLRAAYLAREAENRMRAERAGKQAAAKRPVRKAPVTTQASGSSKAAPAPEPYDPQNATQRRERTLRLLSEKGISV